MTESQGYLEPVQMSEQADRDAIVRIYNRILEVAESLNDEMGARLELEEKVGILDERVITLEEECVDTRAWRDLVRRIITLESEELVDLESFRIETEAIDQRFLALESVSPEAHEQVQDVRLEAHGGKPKRCWTCCWWDAEPEDRWEDSGTMASCCGDLPKIPEPSNGYTFGEWPTVDGSRMCPMWEPHPGPWPEDDTQDADSIADDTMLGSSEVHGGLVERARKAMLHEGTGLWANEIRAAIAAVADWLEVNAPDAADWLRAELED